MTDIQWQQLVDGTLQVIVSWQGSRGGSKGGFRGGTRAAGSGGGMTSPPSSLPLCPLILLCPEGLTAACALSCSRELSVPLAPGQTSQGQLAQAGIACAMTLKLEVRRSHLYLLLRLLVHPANTN